MTILTQIRENSPMLSNFFNSWALTASALVWANLAGFLVQVDIPQEVWAQYPLILIGVGLVIALGRYWVQNEKEWRMFVVAQQQEQKNDQLRVLQLIQTNNEQLVSMIERNHKEQLELQREGQREVFDAALERILESLVKVDHYESQSRRRNDEHQR